MHDAEARPHDWIQVIKAIHLSHTRLLSEITTPASLTYVVLDCQYQIAYQIAGNSEQLTQEWKGYPPG